MSVQTTSGLSQEVATYYDKVFLDRAKYELVHGQGAQIKKLPPNEGKQVVFTRHTPLATATTALTEGVNPAQVSLTAANVSATLAEYGNTVSISRFLELRGIDANNAEKISVVGQNMGETLDELARNELYTGATAQLAGAKSALSDVAASNVLSTTELRKAIRTLTSNKAMKYSGVAPWIVKVGPYTVYDMQADTSWVNAHTYQDTEGIYTGELGRLFGCRFLNSPNQKTESSTVTVYSNFIHGDAAFGQIDPVKDAPQMFIIPNTQIDSNNPAGRYSLVSWAGSYVCKTLNANWLINIKTGATA